MQLPKPNKDSEQYLKKVFFHKIVYLILLAKKKSAFLQQNSLNKQRFPRVSLSMACKEQAVCAAADPMHTPEPGMPGTL